MISSSEEVKAVFMEVQKGSHVLVLPEDYFDMRIMGFKQVECEKGSLRVPLNGVVYCVMVMPGR